MALGPERSGLFVLAEDFVEEGMMGASGEVFALTDEQIVGIGDDEGANRGNGDVEVLRDANDASLRMTNGENAEGELGGGDGKGLTPEGVSYKGEKGPQAGMDAALEPPLWLAERMKDPRDGEEAKELWDGKQRAEKEAAAYREVFATAEDARALKEIYPGGLSEAKSAAERARTLDEIDAAFYRGDGPARMQLAQRMMRQDPAAFREMVEAGVRLLGVGKEVASERGIPRSAGAAQNDGPRGEGLDRGNAGEGLTPEGVGHRDGAGAQRDGVMAPEIAGAYRTFERAANAELEKSVGGAIARMMEEALPNLRQLHTHGQAGAQHAAPLRERLAGAVREEVEAALKSDGQLGEQVAKILAGRRFEDATRAQVVRVIDARAQQLVPGAVRRVVGSWTQATLGASGTGRRSAGGELEELGEAQRRVPASAARQEAGRAAAGRDERQSAAGRSESVNRGRRMDYRKISDEEILGL